MACCEPSPVGEGGCFAQRNVRIEVFFIKVTFVLDYSSTAIAVPLPSQGKAWLLRIARFVLQISFAVIVWTGEHSSPLRVCARRLKRVVEAPTPTAFVQIVSPPPLSKGQAIKITPDLAVLARVRSRRCFCWTALCAEAVGGE